MKVIGITGGIGSGKTLVAHILKEKYQAHILNTDHIAKEQMKVGEASYQAVIDYFGTGILGEDGSIQRSKLAEIVFHDKDKLLKLNELTHPKVLEKVLEDIQLSDEKDIPYLVIESALMIESGFDQICDEVWYVYASEEDRRARLKRDRNYTEERINSVFSNQSREEDFRNKYHKVIENTGDAQRVEEQVKKMILHVQE